MARLRLPALGTHGESRCSKVVVSPSLVSSGSRLSPFGYSHLLISLSVRLPSGPQFQKRSPAWIHFHLFTIARIKVEVDPTAGTETFAVLLAQRLHGKGQHYLLVNELGEIDGISFEIACVQILQGELHLLLQSSRQGEPQEGKSSLGRHWKRKLTEAPGTAQQGNSACPELHPEVALEGHQSEIHLHRLREHYGPYGVICIRRQGKPGRVKGPVTRDTLWGYVLDGEDQTLQSLSPPEGNCMPSLRKLKVLI